MIKDIKNYLFWSLTDSVVVIGPFWRLTENCPYFNVLFEKFCREKGRASFSGFKRDILHGNWQNRRLDSCFSWGRRYQIFLESCGYLTLLQNFSNPFCRRSMLFPVVRSRLTICLPLRRCARCSKSYVGNVMAANPFPWLSPVIGRYVPIYVPAVFKVKEMKKGLLEREGIVFDDTGKVKCSSLYYAVKYS